MKSKKIEALLADKPIKKSNFQRILQSISRWVDEEIKKNKRKYITFKETSELSWDEAVAILDVFMKRGFSVSIDTQKRWFYIHLGTK